MQLKTLRNFSIGLLACTALSFAHAGLFDDDEARKAILELRQRLESSEKKQAEVNQNQAAETARVQRSLLELLNAIESLKADMARQTGQMEQMTRALSDQQRPLAELQRQVAELQRQQKDATQVVDERLRKFEPIKVAVAGKERLARLK